MNELKIFGFKESLYQWDTNQKLVIPYYRPNMEFHFANKVTISKGRSAIVMYPYEQKPDFWVVDVPDVILQEPYNLVVYQCDDDDTKTEYRIKVTPRPKPDDYVYTETEVLKYSQLEERIETLEEQMENGGGGGGPGCGPGRGLLGGAFAAGAAKARIVGELLAAMDAEHNVSSFVCVFEIQCPAKKRRHGPFSRQYYRFSLLFCQSAAPFAALSAPLGTVSGL